MPWYFPWTESIKKKACRYILHHYLGSFLLEKLTVEQLSLDIYNGVGAIHDVHLDVQTINASLYNAGLPLELVDGFIEKIAVSIPWHSLITDNSAVEIKGLQLTLQPSKRPRHGDMSSSLLSQSSMTTSLACAEECLKDDTAAKSLPEGLETFARTIDTVLSHIKVTLLDTTIRLECCPVECSLGIAVELRIGRVDYFDESSADLGTSVDEPEAFPQPLAFTVKNLNISGELSFFTDIFTPCQRSMVQSNDSHGFASSSMTSDVFMSTQFSSEPVVRQPSFIGLRGADSLPVEHGNFHSEPIKFMSTNGEQMVKLKLKNDTKVPGASVSLDVQLGSVAMFLSPKQLHMITELATATMGSAESTSGSSYPGQGHTLKVKPLDSADLDMIENHLQFHMSGAPLVNHTLYQLYDPNFQGLDMEASVDSNMFQSIIGVNGSSADMDSSFCSNQSGSFMSRASSTGYGTEKPSSYQNPPSSSYVFQSAMPPSCAYGHNPSAKHPTDLFLVNDPNTFVQQFKFNLAFAVVVLLNENPQTTPSDTFDRGETDTEKLIKKSERFFDGFKYQRTQGFPELEKFREEISKYCVDNHIKLIARKIAADTKICNSQSRRKHESSTRVELSIGDCDVTEWISNNEKFARTIPALHVQSTSELLTFLTDRNPSLPCVKVSFASSSSRRKGQSGDQAICSQQSLDVRFCRPLFSELDISITDRLHDLLQPSPILVTPDRSKSQYTPHRSAARESSEQLGNLSVCVRSEHDVTLYLRFPIADLRKDQQFPWWRRNLRQEFLQLQLNKPVFKACHKPDRTELEFVFRSMQAFFCMSPGGEKVAFAYVGKDSKDNDEFDLPRLLISLYPAKGNSLNPMQATEKPLDSLEDAYEKLSVPKCSPFSNCKAMFDNEELLVPGNKEEMGNFILRTEANTRLKIQLQLSSVNLIFPSKHVFELLYNRLCNDLLMWESLVAVPHHTHPIMHSVDRGLNSFADWGNELWATGKFALCRSTLQECASDSEDDTATDEMLQSVHHIGPSYQDSVRQELVDGNQSKACVNISITKGRLTLIHAKPKSLAGTDCHGESVLDIEDGVIHIVSCSGGDANLQYIAIRTSQCALYHAGNKPSPYAHPSMLHALPKEPPPGLHLTLKLSPPGIPSKLGCGVGTHGNQDMLGVAVKVVMDPDIKKHLKHMTVSVCLRGALLSHQMVQSNESWILQLMEFLAVEDYDILGHPFPRVVTELHIHVMGGAIEYRPKYLPLRGVVSMEKFSISSNVVVDSPCSRLRFLVEDAAFFISERLNHLHDIDLIKDFVCLLETPHFELVLKKSDGRNKSIPVTDLSASCSAVHIATCADSLRALQTFIDYIANSRDVDEADVSTDTFTGEEAALMSDGSLSDSPTENLPDLMQEAMIDNSTKPTNQPAATRQPASFYPEPQWRQTFPQDMFLFEEDQRKDDGDPMLSDVDDACSDMSGDSDFLFVDLPSIPRDGEPVIEKLDKEYLLVREGFLPTPLSRVDLMRAPAGFPVPVNVYCLSDLTIVWQLYGGKDFGASDKTLGRQRLVRGVVGSSPGREIDRLVEIQLTKVRFQWEIYPENTLQVSRQCLLIQEIEIRDRVAISDVNKLLYQYTSETCPKQQHTSMASIKVVTLRPRMSKMNECNIRVSLQPLRINLDQDALVFVQEFCNNLMADQAEGQECPPSKNAFNCTPNPVVQPVMAVNEGGDMTSKDYRVMFNELDEDVTSGKMAGCSQSKDLFIKTFVFMPDVPIRLDYVGKHVDVEHRLSGLLIGLAQLNRSELSLKSLHFKQGVLGFDRLARLCLEEWRKDITSHQLPTILGGVGPLNSFVQFFQGLQDLVWLPIEQYRKDGRIVRGLQRGASAFSTSTSVALLELTNRAVQTVQFMAELTFDLVSSGAGSKRQHKRRHQPRDMREGVSNAVRLVKEGVNDTASTVIKAAVQENEKKGLAGAVGGVLRQIPPSVVQPLIIATDATSNVLSGLRNQLHPDAHREDVEKWKGGG